MVITLNRPAYEHARKPIEQGSVVSTSATTGASTALRGMLDGVRAAG